MATHVGVSVFIVWPMLAMHFLSLCLADVGHIVTQDIFNQILYGDITLPSNIGVRDIATQGFFNAILSGLPDNCTGKNFYTYSDFINATTLFPGFGTTGTSDDRRREICAFFAIASFVTNGLCDIETRDQTDHTEHCVAKYLQYPCAQGKKYYQRGPLALIWNDNYAMAGYYIGFDGLHHPEIVSENDIISWKTALWIWMVRNNGHSPITSGQGFGATISATLASPSWCSGQAFNVLLKYYVKYCSQIGVSIGDNPSC